jgi:hypothetical protein
MALLTSLSPKIFPFMSGLCAAFASASMLVISATLADDTASGGIKNSCRKFALFSAIKLPVATGHARGRHLGGACLF